MPVQAWEVLQLAVTSHLGSTLLEPWMPEISLTLRLYTFQLGNKHLLNRASVY